eukprot:365519-Chlamydomonas_euryale.AAC.6
MGRHPSAASARSCVRHKCAVSPLLAALEARVLVEARLGQHTADAHDKVAARVTHGYGRESEFARCRQAAGSVAFVSWKGVGKLRRGVLQQRYCLVEGCRQTAGSVAPAAFGREKIRADSREVSTGIVWKRVSKLRQTAGSIGPNAETQSVTIVS